MVETVAHSYAEIETCDIAKSANSGDMTKSINQINQEGQERGTIPVKILASVFTRNSCSGNTSILSSKGPEDHYSQNSINVESFLQWEKKTTTLKEVGQSSKKYQVV